MTDEDKYKMRDKSKGELLNAITGLKSSALQHQLALAELRRRENEEIEKSAEERHRKVERHLEDLKKPHWTVVPTFWFAFISAIAAIVGIFLPLLLKSCSGS